MAVVCARDRRTIDGDAGLGKDTAQDFQVLVRFVDDVAWIGAMATVLPGVTIAPHSVVTAGSVIAEDTESYGIYTGNPAVKVGDRRIR